MSDISNDSDESQRDAHVTTRRPKKAAVGEKTSAGEKQRSSKDREVAMASTQRVDNLKVRPFSPEDPEIWFTVLEGQFENFNITEDTIKYSHVISNLDMEHAKAVKDIITKPPTKDRYKKIKSELIRRLSASHEEKVKKLLTHEELGDRKPSQFLRHLQDLAGPSVPEEFIRTIWSNRLPKNIQTVLASQSTQSLEQLSDLADRIQEITYPHNVAATSSSGPTGHPFSEIAELKKMVERLALRLDDRTRSTNRSGGNDRSRPPQRRPSSRTRSRSRSSYQKYPICWYHSRFGESANKCIKPCDYKKAENFTGGR